MQLSTLLVILGIGILVAAFILFPGLWSLFKGFGKLFIKDMATTPEGARAIYEEQIDELQEKYNIAYDSYKKASGRLATEERKLSNLKTRLKEVESQCEKLVAIGNMESARIKAEEREEILSDIGRSETLVKAYTNAKTEQEELYKLSEKALKDIKKEARNVVENMKVKKELGDLYDSSDELKKATANDKLIQAIREKNEDLNMTVAGAKVVHDNKASTKIRRAEQAAKKAQTNDYLESLKAKHNK